MLHRLQHLNQLDLTRHAETDDAVRLALLDALSVLLAGRQRDQAQRLERELSGLESGAFRFPGGDRLSAIAAVAVGESAARSVAPNHDLALLLAALLPLTLARDASAGTLMSALLAGAIVREGGLPAGAATVAAVAWMNEASPAETVALALTNAHAEQVVDGVLRALAHSFDTGTPEATASGAAVLPFVLPVAFAPENSAVIENMREEAAARFMRRAAPAVKPEQSLIFATNLFLCERATPFRMLWDTLF